MDRMYKKQDEVNVYENQQARDSGIITEKIKRVPYSRAGFDWYMYDGFCFPAYISRDCTEIYIILTDRKPR